MIAFEILVVVAVIGIVSELPFLLHPFMPGSLGNMARHLVLRLDTHARTLVACVSDAATLVADFVIALTFVALGLVTLCPLLAVVVGVWLYHVVFEG